jgi:hypothetical protein
MKKLFLLFTILLFNIGLFAQNQRYYDVRNFIVNLGYTIDETSNVWHQNLAEKEFFYNYKTYYQGTDYILVAFSQDIDVLDIDLWLCDTDGSVFKKDTDIENTAILYFSPAQNYYMKTVVQNYSSNYPYYSSTCWLIIGYK